MGLTIDDDDRGGGDTQKSFDSVPCSICLEDVTDNGDRSFAKLQCGHQFHLDCIGSAFNIKGAMQCPNCRKIEKGQWLYADGDRSYPEFSMDDFPRGEDLYDPSYPETSLGVHWCPFGDFTRFPSSFEEQEFSSTSYHEALEQHAIFAEHSAVSSGSHPCPYIAYLGPAHPSTSTSGGTVSEASNFNHWNGPPVHGDMSTPYTFPSVFLHYQSWDHHSSHFSSVSSRLGAPDHPTVSQSNQRLARGGSEVIRFGSYMHPFHAGHIQSSARGGNSVASSMIPPYQGINARARDRVQALQAYYQPQQPPNSTTIRTPVASNTRRSSSHSGSAPLASVASRPDHIPSYYVPSGLPGRNFQEETHLPSHFHSWRSYNQLASGADPGIRSTSFRLRNDSERMPPQNR